MLRLGAVLASILLLGASPASMTPGWRVVVGDTVEADGETVRLVGLDAPETAGRCAAEVAALAGRALPRGQDQPRL
jgi:endonuclease YncB( thermonuclease family)